MNSETVAATCAQVIRIHLHGNGWWKGAGVLQAFKRLILAGVCFADEFT
jgi:hypothetical protein